MTTPTGESATIETVTKELIELIQNEVGVGADDLTADSLIKVPGMDSLKFMSVVVRIEAKYDIGLDEDEGEDPRTIGDLAELVVRQIEAQS
jgi:acyl carrier protein